MVSESCSKRSWKNGLTSSHLRQKSAKTLISTTAIRLAVQTTKTSENKCNAGSLAADAEDRKKVGRKRYKSVITKPQKRQAAEMRCAILSESKRLDRMAGVEPQGHQKCHKVKAV